MVSIFQLFFVIILKTLLFGRSGKGNLLTNTKSLQNTYMSLDVLTDVPTDQTKYSVARPPFLKYIGVSLFAGWGYVNSTIPFPLLSSYSNERQLSQQRSKIWMGQLAILDHRSVKSYDFASGWRPFISGWNIRLYYFVCFRLKCY